MEQEVFCLIPQRGTLDDAVGEPETIVVLNIPLKLYREGRETVIVQTICPKFLSLLANLTFPLSCPVPSGQPCPSRSPSELS